MMCMLIIVESFCTKILISKMQENFFSSIILNESGCTSLILVLLATISFILFVTLSEVITHKLKIWWQ